MTAKEPAAFSLSPGVTSRQWKSSGRTRRAILDAARKLFSEVGYEHTSIDDIVASSGVSVGSIYHHLGGKAAIFTEVATEVMREQAEASHAAVVTARERGEGDAVELYLIGARAYLMASWRNRRVARVMLGDDQPAGFAQAQQSFVARMVAGTRDIVVGDPVTPGASSRAVTALLRAAAEELIPVETEASAEAVADYFIGLLRRLARVPLPNLDLSANSRDA